MSTTLVLSATLFSPRDYDVHMLRFLIPTIVCFFVASFSLNTHAKDKYRFDEKSDSWIIVSEHDPNSPESQLEEAKQQLDLGNYKEAQTLSSKWITKYKRHPNIPEAHIIHGDALLAQHYYYESLFDYEIVANDHYGKKSEVTANARMYEVATKFAHGTKRLFWGMRITDATDVAEEVFMRISERLPRSQLAEKADLELADLYYRTKDMDLANDMYQLFVEKYPRSENIDKARARLIYTRLATYRGPSFDATGLIDARKELVNLPFTNPHLAETVNSDALITRIDESLGQKMLRTAQWYVKVNNPIAAEFTVRKLIQQHEHTSASIEALEHIIPAIMPKLPPIVLYEVSDFYETYQEALLGRIITPVNPSE